MGTAQLPDQGHQAGDGARVDAAQQGAEGVFPGGGSRRGRIIPRRSIVSRRGIIPRRGGLIAALCLPRLSGRGGSVSPANGLCKLHNLRHAVGVRQDRVQFFLKFRHAVRPFSVYFWVA
ncbi:hypothetical protein SDC9_118476 [bioreactor metagenome]|uniref:Uncharacterized protein n=1 Tax=bioreactor metagenome TaxID=1076179 RepID=A0A645C3H8_9ZZZZ